MKLVPLTLGEKPRRDDSDPAATASHGKRSFSTLHSLNLAWTTGRVEDLVNYFHKDMVAIVPTTRNRLDRAATPMATLPSQSLRKHVLSFAQTRRHRPFLNPSRADRPPQHRNRIDQVLHPHAHQQRDH